MELRHFNYLTIIKTPNAKYYYVGKHSTKNVNDGYFGSGKVIKKICKRFPHKTRLIQEFSTEKEALNAEIELVEKAKSKYGKHSLNFAVGGKGTLKGTKLSNLTRRKMSESKIGIKWSDERKELHKLYVKRGENHPGKRGLSREHKRKLSISGKGKHTGFKHTEESKHSMSASKTGNKNPMFGKIGAMKGKPAPNRNLSWQYADELYKLWISNNMPSEYLFKKIVIPMGYPQCSYKGIISKWQQNSTIYTQA